MVLPLVVAVAFFLIADIDSPRGGVDPGASAESESCRRDFTRNRVSSRED